MALAKLTRPTLYGVAPRQRLFDQLEGQGSAVWIQGGCGAGKTTLLASYLDARVESAVWYELDASDGDVTVFLGGLATVAQTVAGASVPRPAPGPERSDGNHAWAIGALEAIAGVLPEGTRVVLDNVDAVAPDSATHEVLAAELRRSSGQVRFLLASEVDPLGPYELLLDEGALGWVRPDAMKARAGEVGQLARARGLRGVSEERLAQVDACAKGWMAGLVLLLDEVRNGRPLDGSFESPGALFAQVVRTVVDRMTDAEQRLLLEVAVLPFVTARLARSVASAVPDGSANPAIALLERLAEAGMLTTRDRELAGVYRLHPMLRAFLLEEGARSLTEEERLELQRRAGRSLEEEGQLDAARARDAVPGSEAVQA